MLHERAIFMATVVYIQALNPKQLLYEHHIAIYINFFQLSYDQQQTLCIEDEIGITVKIDFRDEVTISVTSWKRPGPPIDIT